MGEMNYDRLRARFSSLRDEDGRSAPEFHPLLNRARSRTRVRAGGRSLRWAAAASILLAALLIVKPWHDRGGRGNAITKTNIVVWQSPTAGLLQQSGSGILAPPPLLSSVFDGVASRTLSLKTD